MEPQPDEEIRECYRARRSPTWRILAMGACAWLVSACGGSSSETPMPLEPVPHQGPEAASERESADVESSASDPGDDDDTGEGAEESGDSSGESSDSSRESSEEVESNLEE